MPATGSAGTLTTFAGMVRSYTTGLPQLQKR